MTTTSSRMKTTLFLASGLALLLTPQMTARAADGEILQSANRPPVQTFYAPLPETSVLQALQSIHGGANWSRPSSPLYSYTSISVFVDGTVIYYDQWEDGYERDIANPNHLWSPSNPTGTQIWGDGDPSNGYPPDMPGDVLNAGEVIILSDKIPVDRIGRNAYWDGGDKFASTKPVSASRIVWASESKTLFAGGNEMYDTSYFGNGFVCPFGEDTPKQNEIFEYTGLMIMAGPDGASIALDTDADGKTEYTYELAEGETVFVDGGVHEGATVTASAGSVQVDIVTGDVYDGYESRFYKLLPTRMWSTAYTSPVGTSSRKGGSRVWMYNPGDTALQVTWETRSRSGKTTLPARASGYVAVTDANSGIRVTADAPFYACQAIDCVGRGTSTRRSGGDNRTYDWGLTLVPDNALSTQIVTGIGLGQDPTERQTENSTPVWVTSPIRDTVVYVDYDGNLSTGSRVDPNGNRCDQIVSLDRLDSTRLYNPSGDQTGMLVYTLDGTRICAAWGSDPSKASSGSPGLDLGTGIPPMPECFVQKESELTQDNDGDGWLTPGDTLTYRLQVLNVGRQPVTDITLREVLPEAGIAYVEGTFAYTNPWGTKRALPDAAFTALASESGLEVTALDENFIPLYSDGTLNPGETWTFSFDVELLSLSGEEPDSLLNRVILETPYSTITNSVQDALRCRIGDWVWLDANGNGMQDAGEKPLPGVMVTLVDAQGNTVTDDRDLPYTAVTGADGAYLFRGVRPGTYAVAFSAPAAYTLTTADSGTDDEIDSDPAAATGRTALFTIRGGRVNLTHDAGFVIAPDANAAVSLVKTADSAPDGEPLEVSSGDTVVYSYTITNTGSVALRDLTLTDDKLGDIAELADLVLAPGESVVLTAEAMLLRDTVNIATVTGTPCADDGSDLPYVSDEPSYTVSAEDDATVLVPDAEPEPTSSLGSIVWCDADGDGIRDAGERGVSGVPVTLLRVTADGLETVATAKTDAAGVYRFTGLSAGDYLVRFSPNDSWSFTLPLQGDDTAVDSDAHPETGETETITLSAGEDLLTIDCGLVGGIPPGVCDWLEIAEKYNALIMGNLTTGTGDTEGNLLVGGNAMLGYGYSVGLIGPGYGRTRDAARPGTDALVVRGDLTESSVPDINGNVVYGGTYTNLTGTTAYRAYELRHVAPVTLDADWNVPEDGSGRTLEDVAADIVSFAKMAAALPDSEGVVYDASNPWDIVWTGTNTWRNVFSVTTNTFTLASNGIRLDVPPASKVLVNIFADTVNWTYASIALPEGMSPSQVLFNFVGTKTIETSGFLIPGSVLAPDADGAFLGGSIDGFAFFGGDVLTDTGFEFHDYPFLAFDCSESDVVTLRPALTLTTAVTAAEGVDGFSPAAEGELVRLPAGSVATLRWTIANPSTRTLSGIRLTDPLTGAVFAGPDTLAPGAAWTQTVTRVIGASTNVTASVTAAVDAVEGEDPYAGWTLTATDDLRFVTYDEAGWTAHLAAEALTAPAGAYVPRPDFEVTAIAFIEKPTITGDVFSVSVTIANSGEVSAIPGRLAIYIDAPEPVTAADLPDAWIDLTATDKALLAGGEGVTYEFHGLRAPADAGALHVRALIDAQDSVEELSEGNNQLPVFAWLIPITVHTSLSADGVTLRWNSYEGQVYSIRAAETVEGDAFAPCEGTDVNGIDLTNIPATPPENSVTIPLDDSRSMRFFRLRAEILNDAADLK